MSTAPATQVPAAYAAGAGPHPISEIAEIFGISRVSVRVRAARMAREKREGGAA